MLSLKKVNVFLHLIVLPSSLIWNEQTAWFQRWQKHQSEPKSHKICFTPSRWKNKIQDRQIRGTALNASVSSNIIITVLTNFRRSSSLCLVQSSGHIKNKSKQKKEMYIVVTLQIRYKSTNKTGKSRVKSPERRKLHRFTQYCSDYLQ